MIKLVAFDWNGTILSDTLPVWRGNNAVFARFNLPPISLRKFKETYDMPILNYWAANGFDKKNFLANHKEIRNIFNNYYSQNITKTRTRSGAKQTLQWLDKNGISSIIYSNHFISNIQGNLSRLGISSCFHKILALEERDHSHMHTRTKEHKLSCYIKDSGYKPKEVISVGDTIEEIEVGCALGCYTVALTGGYNSVTRLKACKPDFLINNLKDLIPIVKKLNNQRQ